MTHIFMHARKSNAHSSRRGKKSVVNFLKEKSVGSVKRNLIKLNFPPEVKKERDSLTRKDFQHLSSADINDSLNLLPYHHNIFLKISYHDITMINSI